MDIPKICWQNEVVDGYGYFLQNGANPDDIVPNRPNSEAQECEKEALWELRQRSTQTW
jgi:hypothetical protein